MIQLNIEYNKVEKSSAEVEKEARFFWDIVNSMKIPSNINFNYYSEDKTYFDKKLKSKFLNNE